MPSLYTEIEIEAPKEHVWEILFHKEGWRQWNTFLFDCDPTKPFQQGREVSLSLRRLEGEEETEFQPIITLIRPNVCLRWVSKVPGLKNEYIFELHEIGPGRTKYIHRDNFSGILSGVFLPFIRQDEKHGLKRMARQLKRHIERGMIYERR